MKAINILTGVAVFAVGYGLGGRKAEILEKERLVWRVDTVVEHRPRVVTVRELQPDTAWLVRADSVVHDTVEVVVPRQQVLYGGEGYSAWVSGYGARLDSLVLTRPKIYGIIKEKRWSVGLQAGVGMTPRGVQPYIGVGVSMKLW